MMASTRPTAAASPVMARATNSSGTSVVSLIVSRCASVTKHSGQTSDREADHEACTGRASWTFTVAKARCTATTGHVRSGAFTPSGRVRSRSVVNRPLPPLERRHENRRTAPSRPARVPLRSRSGDEASAEAVGDGLGPVAHTELAEESPGVRLHGVFRQVELAADLAVALALAHAPQHLQLTLGELDAGVGGRPGRGHRGAGQRVRERGHQLGTRGVPPQVAP